MIPFHPKTINPPNPFSLLFYNKKAQMNTDNMIPIHRKMINPPNPFSLLFYMGKRAPKQAFLPFNLKTPIPIKVLEFSMKTLKFYHCSS